MASTIKLKRGSGEPGAGALVEGEPAFDLTNKRLYTENSGGTVLEIGTNPTTLQVDGTLTVGVDDTGYDVEFFGATSGKSMLWDESADSLIVNGTVDVVGTVTADGLTVNADTSTFTSANASDPLVIIKNTANDASGARLSFQKDKGANAADGDDIGTITFIGDNNAQEQTNYASIVVEVSESQDTDEAGKMSFFVAESNGTTSQLTAGLIIEGEHATDGEVDVTIAAGASSTTTVAGLLNTGGNLDVTGTVTADGLTVDTDGQVIVNHSVTGGGIRIDSTNSTNVGSLRFGDVADNYIGALEYDHSSDAMTMYVNNDVRMTIDNSGNVGIPTGDLTIGSGQAEGVILELSNTDSVSNGLQIQLSGNGKDVYFWNYEDATTSFATNNVERFKIASDGSLSTPTLGTDNVRFGENAGNSILSGGLRNVLIGKDAGTALTTGDSNVAIGWEALKTEDTHANSVAVGASALATQNAGADAYNVAVGYNAGLGVTTGIKNVLIGGLAGDVLTDSDDNVAVGMNALTADTLGSKSTAVGSGALAQQNYTSAADTLNVAIGFDACNDLTTGTQNTIIGAYAGDALTGGGFTGATRGSGADYNTAMGYSALSYENLGSRSTALGYFALNVQRSNSATDVLNTAVGFKAGASVSTGTNNMLLGAESGLTGSPGGACTTGTNRIALGDENVDNCHIQVDWTVASDARDKTDFTALDLGLDFVKALAPVTYKWDKRSKYGDKHAEDYDLNAQTPDGTHKEDRLDIGFKAQDVQALEEAAGYTSTAKKNLTVSTSDDGKQMGIQYSKFVPILVKAIQEQQTIIEALTARIEALEG